MRARADERPTMEPESLSEEWLRERLDRAARELEVEGVPYFPAEGRLLRPFVACAFAGASACDNENESRPFWYAVLAVQLAHQASLLHDDIVDGATERRGEATVATRRGTAAALVLGDHVLAAGYRAAAATGDPRFFRLYTRAVERTIAGERMQGAALGEQVDERRWREIVLAKSGELFGCAAAATMLLASAPATDDHFETGRRVGMLYQMLDDLLDYCPRAGTGKPPLSDHATGRWTWVLGEARGVAFGMGPRAVLDALFSTPPGQGEESPARRLLARFDSERQAVLRELPASALGGPMNDLLEGWFQRAQDAVSGEEQELPAVVLPQVEGDYREYFARNSLSFRFSAAWLARPERDRIARVYSWCRYTDDLVDEATGLPAAAVHERLDRWEARSRDAYEGASRRNELVDVVMREMAEAGVPFIHASDLIDGMRTDIDFAGFHDMQQLRSYTYRAAGVVGLWLAKLHGVSDPWMLDRAAALGHAMQLTNILRDVGEDWARGRLYIPLAMLESHGLERGDIGAMRAGERPIDESYRALMEELMSVAERDYARAKQAIPLLPGDFRKAVSVAAEVYSGIHGAIRRNGYDNLQLRARTTVGAKALLAVRGLWGSRANWNSHANPTLPQPRVHAPAHKSPGCRVRGSA
jgi:15-cis-phytoene synthase